MRTRRHTVTVPHGYRIGDWNVDEPLASGTFTTVYAAHRTHGTPRTAALKFWPTTPRTPQRPTPCAASSNAKSNSSNTSAHPD